MSQLIEAIYENGVFRPLHPVDLAEGATVQFDPRPPDPFEAQLRLQLLERGLTEADIEFAFSKLRPLWEAFDGLTEEQEKALAEARIDQDHFFDRPE